MQEEQPHWCIVKIRFAIIFAKAKLSPFFRGELFFFHLFPFFFWWWEEGKREEGRRIFVQLLFFNSIFFWLHISQNSGRKKRGRKSKMLLFNNNESFSFPPFSKGPDLISLFAIGLLSNWPTLFYDTKNNNTNSSGFFFLLYYYKALHFCRNCIIMLIVKDSQSSAIKWALTL